MLEVKSGSKVNRATTTMPPYVLLYTLGLTLSAGVWCVSHSLAWVAGVLSDNLGHVLMLGLAALFLDWWTSWERSFRLSPRAIFAVGGIVGALALLMAVPAQSFVLMLSSPEGWSSTLVTGSTISGGLIAALGTSIPAFVIALGVSAAQYTAPVRTFVERRFAR